jgi:hypothetical protein
MTEAFLNSLKRDIQAHFQQKYGDVFIDFDQLAEEQAHTTRIQLTISDHKGFITRHYGRAGYRDNTLFVETLAI